MTGEDQRPEPSNAETEEEIRLRRKFTTTEAIARLAGPGAMKGASPVSPKRQAEAAISCWIRDHVTDGAGALHLVLQRHVNESALLLDNFEEPLIALEAYCRRCLTSEAHLKALVHDADVEWGRRMDERPFFDRDGTAPSADDPYSAASVRETLEKMVALLSEK
jgi:hypothetical protein